MPVVRHEVLRELSFEICKAAGIPVEDARIVSDHVVNSNLKGHDSHGVWYLPWYVRGKKGHRVGGMREQYVRWEEHEVVRESPSLAIIDGHGANGIVAMTQVVNTAVEKARTSTIGIVTLNNVTHVGRLGDYPPRIAGQGMIGIVWTNTGGVFMAPFGSGERRLPPNPMAFAVPRRHGPPFMLDMSLSVVAGGKVLQKEARNEPVPDGWLIDQQGHYVSEAARFFDPQVAIPPLGGLESGHKGHGLAMMMEMIVGPLSLAGCTQGDSSGNGIMVLAIDIGSFTDLDTYEEQVEGLAKWVKSAKPLPGVERVYAPGEIEEETQRRRLKEGIDIAASTWAELGTLAEELNVRMPEL